MLASFPSTYLICDCDLLCQTRADGRRAIQNSNLGPFAQYNENNFPEPGEA